MIRQYLIRSLVHYRRSHIWVVLGTLVSTAILTGALMVGDSIRYSMDRIVFNRLGDTQFALVGGDRLFTEELSARLDTSLQVRTAPLLQTGGIAVAGGGRYRHNSVQIAGVDRRFGDMGGGSDLYGGLGNNEAVVNSVLAERLHLEPGDEFLLRFEKIDKIPRDAPLAVDEDMTVSRRFTVRAVASAAEFGSYNLKNDQITPHTVFLNLNRLQQLMDMPGRANVLLAAPAEDRTLPAALLSRHLRDTWTLEDSGLELTELADAGAFELRSGRLFMDQELQHAAERADPRAESVFSYFVNEIRKGKRAVPYSFAAAADGLFTEAPADSEIIINEWLAADLQAGPGDPVSVSYYVLGPMRTLQEKTAVFRVKKTVPLRGRFADRTLMPDFPGLSGEESCSDWNPGIPIDLEKIRDKDEAYWDDYRGTPKVFIAFSRARKLWSNRFGTMTGIRFYDTDLRTLRAELTAVLDPARQGFYFRPVREEGLRASGQAVDFGQLFLGLSFFVIASALLLTGLLFVFNVENRSEQTGILLALGLPRRLIRNLVLAEGALLALLGSAAGGPAGIFVNRLLILSLRTVWGDIVGTSYLQGKVNVPTVLIGIAAGCSMALVTILLLTRRQLKQQAALLQRGTAKIEGGGSGSFRLSLGAGLVSLAGLALILFLGDPSRGKDAFGLFFAAGTLCITGGMAWLSLALQKTALLRSAAVPGPGKMGIRNASRNRTRSIAFAGLLAGGIFIVFTVGANRKSAHVDAQQRYAGTGGFALLGESSVPVLGDLNSDEGRRNYALEQVPDSTVRFVQFRVKEGDDASCLNLNRIARPRLLGVDPGELISRSAFTFAETVSGADTEEPWSLLDRQLDGGVVPAVADLTVIVWGLGKSVGDTLTYVNEQGREFQVKLMAGLANSVMQGNLIISEESFLEQYPSVSGYRFFLVDAPFDRAERTAQNISLALQDEGLDLVYAPDRLADFNNIENTYLSIFLILGSFGLIIGSIGILIMVSRSVNERLGELALLRAVGFSRRDLQNYILAEHLAMLGVGMFLGVSAAFFSTLPTLTVPGAAVPWFSVVLLLALVFGNGFFWTVTAVRRAARGEPLAGLRNE